mgnify:CR=1 FL=1
MRKNLPVQETRELHSGVVYSAYRLGGGANDRFKTNVLVSRKTEMKIGPKPVCRVAGRLLTKLLGRIFHSTYRNMMTDE